MSGKNRKNKVISSCDTVSNTLQKINHISSINAGKLIERFDKINRELNKLYDHQLDDLSDPIPEESQRKSPSKRKSSSRSRRRSSSDEIDDLFKNAHKKVKGSKHISRPSARLKKTRKKRHKKRK